MIILTNVFWFANVYVVIGFFICDLFENHYAVIEVLVIIGALSLFSIYQNQ